MRMYDIIEHKRDGRALSHEEISYFVQGYVAGEIPDYQASALLMAIFLCGMDGIPPAAWAIRPRSPSCPSSPRSAYPSPR